MASSSVESPLTPGRLLPLLEPLCKATAATLEPIRTFASDLLQIDIDDEARRFNVRLTTVRRGAVDHSWSPSGAAGQLLRRFPEASPHPDQVSYHWLVAATDVSALVIFHAWPQEQIEFLSDAARTVYEYLLHRFLAQSRNAALIANFKIEHSEPLMPPDFIEHPDYPLAPYQKVGVLCGLERDAFGLFMEQGTGKTYTAIAMACLEAQRKWRTTPGDMYRVLVVCPRQVRTNWCKEFGRFATVPGKTTILRGSKLSRMKSVVAAIRQEPNTLFTALVTSYESVENTWESISMVPWDRIIIDESHKAKWHRTLRFRTLRLLRDHCRRRLILTGTPIANSIMDLWTQLELLGDGLSGFLSYENYRKFYGEYRKSGEDHGVQKLVAIKNIPLIQERLARLTFMITKVEAGLNLPDMTEDVVEITLTRRQREMYCQLRDRLAIEIEAELDSTSDEPSARTLSAEHILTRLLRLSQITSGFIKYDDEFNLDTGELLRRSEIENIVDIDQNPKIRALIDMIRVRTEGGTDSDEEDDGADGGRDPRAKAIVWATWRQDEANIVAALTRAGIGFVVYTGNENERDRAIWRFNNEPEVRVIIGNPKKLAEGANLLGYDWHNAEPVLDTYCDLEVFYSENWSILERSQAKARAHRRGTRRSVRVATLCAAGTIDEEVYDRLMSKVSQANLIQDIRSVLRRICELNPIED